MINKIIVVLMSLVVLIISGCDMFKDPVGYTGTETGINKIFTSFRKMNNNNTISAMDSISDLYIMSSPSLRSDRAPNSFYHLQSNYAHSTVGDTAAFINGVRGGQTYDIALVDLGLKTSVIIPTITVGSNNYLLNRFEGDILNGIFKRFSITSYVHDILQDPDNSSDYCFVMVYIVEDHQDIYGLDLQLGSEQNATPSANYFGHPLYGGPNYPDNTWKFQLPKNGIWGFNVTALVKLTTIRKLGVRLRVVTANDYGFTSIIEDDTVEVQSTLQNGIVVTVDSLVDGYSNDITVSDTLTIGVGGGGLGKSSGLPSSGLQAYSVFSNKAEAAIEKIPDLALRKNMRQQLNDARFAQRKLIEKGRIKISKNLKK